MSKLQDIDQFVNLYDFYKNLLTKIQQQDFEMYFFEDMSLEEIALNLHKSKTAVFDNLKKVQKNLLDFESKLHLAKKAIIINELLDNIYNVKSLEEMQKILMIFKKENKGE